MDKRVAAQQPTGVRILREPIRRITATSVVAMVAMFGSILVANASNPANAGPVFTDPCWWQGASYFGSSSYSNTNKSGGTCSQQLHVHAYFWNGSAYDYRENTGYGTVIQVNYGSSSWIWGYHEYPAGSNQIVSNAT